MRTLGFGEVSSNLCGFLFFTPWIIDHLDYGKLVQSALMSIIEVFFSELGSRGTSKVPEGGPVILAIAPHANQFVDPIVVMRAFKRPVHFLIAAKGKHFAPPLG